MFYVYLCLLALKTLEASGLNVTMEDVANTDHFSIIEKLVDGEYHLTKVQHTQNATKKLQMNVEASFCLALLDGSNSKKKKNSA